MLKKKVRVPQKRHKEIQKTHGGNACPIVLTPNKMRDALKLDESADANTVVAEYERATLDPKVQNMEAS